GACAFEQGDAELVIGQSRTHQIGDLDRAFELGELRSFPAGDRFSRATLERASRGERLEATDGAAATLGAAVGNLTMPDFAAEAGAPIERSPVEHDARAQGGAHVDPDVRSVALRSADLAFGDRA